jgi:hypothetical protein
MGSYEDGSVGSFPSVSMTTTRACFHAGGKYCLLSIALETFVRKFIGRLGRCLRALSGVLFGPGSLPTLSNLVFRRTSKGLFNDYLLAELTPLRAWLHQAFL